LLPKTHNGTVISTEVIHSLIVNRGVEKICFSIAATASPLLPLQVLAVILSAAKNPEELNPPHPVGAFSPRTLSALYSLVQMPDSIQPKNVISTEAIHGPVVNRGVEKSASPSRPLRLCFCRFKFLLSF